MLHHWHHLSACAFHRLGAESLLPTDAGGWVYTLGGVTVPSYVLTLRSHPPPFPTVLPLATF